jgi:Gluconate 2-dehydrogenase subunit 3
MDRKQFLQRIGLLGAAGRALRAVAAEPPSADASPFTPAEKQGLRVLADEIVPAGEGMPSAGEQGAVAYFEQVGRREKPIGTALRAALGSAERLSQATYGQAFTELPRAQRVAVLKAMQKQEPQRFNLARDLVYEAYYTNPAIWRRLGYEFVEAGASGRPLEPFEESLIQRVRALPKLYRSVP